MPTVSLDSKIGPVPAIKQIYRWNIHPVCVTNHPRLTKAAHLTAILHSVPCKEKEGVMKKSVTTGKATAVAEKTTPTPKTVAKTAVKTTAKKEAQAPQSMVISVAPEVCAENLAEKIAERAYLIWEAAGYQHGYHEEHWLEAEKQVAKESK
jgi:hypothetical protein